MKFPSPSSAEAVIAASGVSRHFGAKAALDDVSMFVPRGSVLGLVGENGAGKTTLIKLFNLWRTVFCMGLLTLAGKAKTDLNVSGEIEWMQNWRFRMGSSSLGFYSTDSLKTLLPSSPF
jgi:ABC-type transporter Mla maintaining outer membrane lipid asymmetry ATPase subunit MlaF